jgi:PAS domain S-box-containing protein
MDSPGRALPTIDYVFDHAPCGLLTTSVQGTIVRVNATFCRWLGYDAADLLEKRRIQDLLTVGGKVFHQTHWAPLLQMQRSVAEVKVEVVRKDGKILPMLINACRHRHEATEFDEFAAVVVIDRHQYERELLLARQHAEAALEAKRAAQQALQEADRRKDEFMATLAHELRNPLAPMRTVLELLRPMDFADPQVRWSHDVLERQLTQMTSLVDGLLEVSRISAGKITLRKERLDLAAVMKRSAETSESMFAASSHRLVFEPPSQPVVLNADPTRLYQVIQNLLNNAAKYTPAGGTIWLSGTRSGDEAVISVRDTGIGIAAEDIPSLFEMFAQLPSGLKHSQGGLGIGLSLVQTLAQLHGGTVSAASVGIGLGSEFVVRLPVSEDQGSPPTVAQHVTRPRSAKQHRVLIIDDNEDAATSLALLLESEGHAVCTAFDGKNGLRLAHDFSPGAIVLDIGLPDTDGYEVARLIRQQPSGQVKLMIAVTGWGQEADKQAAKNAGFDFHFTKPVDLDRLLAVLNQHAP